jgi:hypothetical protein
MDVQLYFQKVRLIEAGFTEPFVMVVSEATPDGGKAGQLTEVSKFTAARLIVDNRARAATDEEAATFREEQKLLRLNAEANDVASKIQVTLIHETDAKGQRSVRPKA